MKTRSVLQITSTSHVCTCVCVCVTVDLRMFVCPYCNACVLANTNILLLFFSLLFDGPVLRRIHGFILESLSLVEIMSYYVKQSGPKRSSAFDHFLIIEPASGPNNNYTATCKHCFIPIKGSHKSTSNLIKHLKVRISHLNGVGPSWSLTIQAPYIISRQRWGWHVKGVSILIDGSV